MSRSVSTYRVTSRYPSLDLLDRWAVVTNRGNAPVTLESVQSGTWHVPASRDYDREDAPPDVGRLIKIVEVRLCPRGDFKAELEACRNDPD